MVDQFKMNSPKRRVARNNYDPSSVDSNTYNDAAGSRKVSDVGHYLEPIIIDAATFTTDLTTARIIGEGTILALYNSDTAVHSITLSDTAVVALAAGTVSGSLVGIALPPGQYTYINTYTHKYAITDSNKVFAYKVVDDTYMNFRRQA